MNKINKVFDEKSEEVELVSIGMSEIMGVIPNNIINRGIVIISSIFFLIIFASFLFKYPDVINGKFEITTSTPPTTISALKSGIIDHHFINDGEQVNKGDLLFSFDNAGDFHEILRLEEYINNLNINSIDDNKFINSINRKPFNNLGSLQESYSTLFFSLQSYRDYLKISTVDKRIFELNNKDSLLKKSVFASMNILNIRNKEFILREEQLKKDSILHAKKVISDFELKTSISKQLKILRENKEYEKNILNIEIELNSIKKEIEEINISFLETKTKLANNIQEAATRLSGEIDIWKKNNLIYSNSNGILHKYPALKTKTFIRKDQQIGMITPYLSKNMTGIIHYPKKNSGKVRQGQKVILRFDSYNPQQYGVMYCEINHISPIVDSIGVCFFSPKDTLITNTSYTIPFHQRISGQAEIITEDLSLFTRIVYPLKAIFDQ